MSGATFEDEVYELASWISAAKKLHRPITGESTFCEECSRQRPLGEVVLWPCNTVKALSGEKGREGHEPECKDMTARWYDDADCGTCRELRAAYTRGYTDATGDREL